MPGCSIASVFASDPLENSAVIASVVHGPEPAVSADEVTKSRFKQQPYAHKKLIILHQGPHTVRLKNKGARLRAAGFQHDADSG